MKLFAISDLHLAYRVNQEALAELGPHRDDWILVVGDVGETDAHLAIACETLCARFARVFWTPGNHELWARAAEGPEGRGVAKYERLVALCRRYGVTTPEDPYAIWEGEGGPCVVAPIFTLYDYSFRPPGVIDPIAWALEEDTLCSDEALLHPDPYPSREAWCAARCALTETRLDALDPALPTVLAGHFPLRREFAATPAVPRFSIWCGTTRTEDWHRRFRAKVVVSGHLHLRSTRWRDGVRFEEVSLGYPRQWQYRGPIEGQLREILPGNAHPSVPPFGA